jgi:hypothetical protein
MNNQEQVSFPEFKGFNKIPRLSRIIVITEKIDGTSGLIYIDENNNIFAGSRNRWLWGNIQDEIHNDNHGFAQWVKANQDELKKLGQGYHYGEFWGKGIQRGYGLEEKRFSLFNVSRWKDDTLRPACCEIVPILYEGQFSEEAIGNSLNDLKTFGSVASPAFMKPEGIVIYHVAGRLYFKKTLENDEKGKDEQI